MQSSSTGLDTLHTKSRAVRRLGWLPDLPDHRDQLMGDALPHLTPVPPGTTKFSLEDQSPEAPWDQGQIGSCTGHGVGYVDQFERKKQGLVAYRPSRLAVYYGGRVLENSVNIDAGAQIRDVMKATATVGVGPEDLWPYDTARFADPLPQAYLDAAAKGQTVQYMRAPRDLTSIKTAIYNGYPVVMGFSVYESFESQAVADTGMMPMPQRHEQLLGGHCTVWIGWDDSLVMPNTSARGALYDRNSWGTQWGLNGHFWMPYAYSQSRNLSSDFWTLRVIEAA